MFDFFEVENYHDEDDVEVQMLKEKIHDFVYELSHSLGDFYKSTIF